MENKPTTAPLPLVDEVDIKVPEKPERENLVKDMDGNKVPVSKCKFVFRPVSKRDDGSHETNKVYVHIDRFIDMENDGQIIWDVNTNMYHLVEDCFKSDLSGVWYFNLYKEEYCDDFKTNNMLKKHVNEGGDVYCCEECNKKYSHKAWRTINSSVSVCLPCLESLSDKYIEVYSPDRSKSPGPKWSHISNAYRYRGFWYSSESAPFTRSVIKKWCWKPPMEHLGRGRLYGVELEMIPSPRLDGQVIAQQVSSLLFNRRSGEEISPEERMELAVFQTKDYILTENEGTPCTDGWRSICNYLKLKYGNGWASHPDVTQDSIIELASLKFDRTVAPGFEVVTVPMAIDVQREFWKNFIENKPDGLTSWTNGRCGMHVHVGKKYKSSINGKEEHLSKLQIDKANVFINNPYNTRFLEAIAGRDLSSKHSKTYCKFQECRYGIVNHPTSGNIRSGSIYPEERYAALNITGSHTIEFRLFRGSLVLRTVLKNIEFCDALLSFASVASIADSQSYKQFRIFVRNRASYFPNLCAYMEEHKMFDMDFEQVIGLKSSFSLAKFDEAEPANA